MAIPLKYLSNFRRTLEIPFINCEINLNLTWYEDCVISSATGETKFGITDAKPYVPVVTSRNRYQSKLLIERQNQYLDYLSRNKRL